MQAVILAGGLGTRLSTMTAGLPKALVDVAGKPLLHWQIELLARHGFTQVLLLVMHRADQIRRSCGDGSSFGVTLDYVTEVEPRGTAGAVLAALERLQDAFVVLYGDTVLNVDLARMRKAHIESDADATLFVHPNDHPDDSDIIEADADGRIIAIHPYPHPAPMDLPNLVSAALYMIERQCLRSILPPRGIFDFGRDLFPMLLSEGRYLRVYRSREYVKDAGTPDRLRTIVADVRSGRVAAGSLETKAQAIFLDRDGTLNEMRGYIASPDDLRLLPGVGTSIRELNRSQYLSVVITNQPVVARGAINEPGLQRIHNRLEQLLACDGAYLDAIYYCPHHPERGFAGERPEYKIACSCRKPAPALVKRAMADMNIDANGSWMLGDTFRDIDLAERTGLLSILLATGNEDQNNSFARRPDFELYSLDEAVAFVLRVWPDLSERARTIAQGLKAGDVVLIGGLAGAGKSSLASAIAWQLRQRAMSAKTVSVDGWLKPLAKRSRGGTVLDRFDIPRMGRSISQLDEGAIMVPLYNRLLRRPDKQNAMDIGKSDIVIVEGVVALMLAPRTTRRVVRIFVSRDEQRRYEYLAAHYRTRHFTAEEFAALYAERQKDETPYVMQTEEQADIVVQTP